MYHQYRIWFSEETEINVCGQRRKKKGQKRRSRLLPYRSTCSGSSVCRWRLWQRPRFRKAWTSAGCPGPRTPGAGGRWTGWRPLALLHLVNTHTHTHTHFRWALWCARRHRWKNHVAMMTWHQPDTKAMMLTFLLTPSNALLQERLAVEGGQGGGGVLLHPWVGLGQSVHGASRWPVGHGGSQAPIHGPHTCQTESNEPDVVSKHIWKTCRMFVWGIERVGHPENTIYNKPFVCQVPLPGDFIM